uniref:Uncharacterized protein n=1 Tax=Arundo donax TaxID=35708 RepID=A0A0A9F9W7_ARUDO
MVLTWSISRLSLPGSNCLSLLYAS